MKDEFQIIPGKAIGPIQFGMRRQEVVEILGDPIGSQEAHERWSIKFSAKDLWFDNCLQIRYSTGGIVEDIQVSQNPNVVVRFLGVAVNEDPFEVVSERVEEQFQRDPNENEFPHVYSYPQIGIAFWRENLEGLRLDTVNLTLPSA